MSLKLAERNLWLFLITNKRRAGKGLMIPWINKHLNIHYQLFPHSSSWISGRLVCIYFVWQLEHQSRVVVVSGGTCSTSCICMHSWRQGRKQRVRQRTSWKAGKLKGNNDDDDDRGDKSCKLIWNDSLSTNTIKAPLLIWSHPSRKNALL